jgi:hypothetical protein
LEGKRTGKKRTTLAKALNNGDNRPDLLDYVDLF